MAGDERARSDADDGPADTQLSKSNTRPSLPGDADGPRSLDHVLHVDTGNAPPITNPKRAQSMPNTADTTAQTGDHGSPQSPLRIAPVQASKTAGIAPHKNVRASEEFDRRFDGPFGRPSLAMERRRSSITPASPIRQGVVSPIGQPEREKLDDQAAGSEGESSGRVIQPIFEPEPPPLNYTLRTRKIAILLFWTVIVFDSVAMPIALYFGLWYGVGPGTNTPTEEKEKLSANTVFSIVTAAIGGASIIEYFLRFWRLWRKNSTCRVIGARRWYLDWFHWNFSLAWIIVMIELIVGSVPEHPPIRLLSMPLATMLYTFGTELLIVDICRYFQVPAPCRISSIPKGAQLRPGIYSLIEDICSVDGSGGTAFREAFDRRYEASHIFRAMLRRLGVFWAVGAEGTAVVCTILIFTIGKDAAYVVGWSVPFIWAGIWTPLTFWYVKRELKKERIVWAEEVARKTQA